MSYSKDQFMDEQERICDEYASGGYDRVDAYNRLIRMGFDPHEANNLLDGAIG